MVLTFNSPGKVRILRPVSELQDKHGIDLKAIRMLMHDFEAESCTVTTAKTEFILLPLTKRK